jgi:hypothetical protein
LAQRLATDFSTDARFDSPRAVQLRLLGFDLDRLTELGQAVRDLFAGVADHPERVTARVDDDYVRQLALAVTGHLGGKVGVAPRIFLRKLVADVLDRVDLYPDFDPRKNYALTVSTAELTETERNAAAGAPPPGGAVVSAGSVDLDLDVGSDLDVGHDHGAGPDPGPGRS